MLKNFLKTLFILGRNSIAYRLQQ